MSVTSTMHRSSPGHNAPDRRLVARRDRLVRHLGRDRVLADSRRNQDASDFNASLYDDATSHGRIRPSLFSCECGKPNCVEVVALDPDEYQVLRAGDGYVLAPSHHVSRGQDLRRVARKLHSGVKAHL